MGHPAIKAALVGYGFVGKTFHGPLIVATRGIELASVVSSNPDRVREDHPEVRVFADLGQALADPATDVVVIATPDDLHALQAHAALDAGKHVVIDKPFALTLEAAQEIAAHACSVQREVIVFHNRRWDSDFLTLKSLIASGQLGEIMQFESRFDRFRPEVRDRWREQPGAGILNDLGPHLIDQALVLFGRPEAVYADLAVQKVGGKANDYFHLLLRYPRLRVHLHADQMTLDSNLRMAVHGSRGSYRKTGMDPQEDQLKAGMRPGTPGYGVDSQPGRLTCMAGNAPAELPIRAIAGDYGRFYAGVRDTIVAGLPSPVPVEEALLVMTIIELARKSAAERREIAF